MRIPLGKRDNVATFPMASGFDKFRAFCCEAELDETTRTMIALPSGLVSDNEDDDKVETQDKAEGTNTWQSPTTPPLHDLDGPSSTLSKGEKSKASTEKSKAPTEKPKELPKTTDMDLPRTTNVNIILDKEDRQPANDLAELLAIHHQFGHILMRKIQEMAKQGICRDDYRSAGYQRARHASCTPKQPRSKCRIPTCSACLYAKATKRPWRSKPKKDGNHGNKPTKPGQVVSVNQLVSPTPGLIAQMTGPQSAIAMRPSMSINSVDWGMFTSRRRRQQKRQ